MADAAPEIRPQGPARKPGIVANILAIVGFIILIIIVIWGLLHIISLSTPWFSDTFSGSKKTEITVTAPSEVAANTPFNVSWKHSSPNRGTYAILYTCVKGLKMSVDGNAIPCGAAYTVGNATGTASMLPTLTGTTSVNTAISILYIPSAAGTTGPEATGSATVRVVSAEPITIPPVVITPVVITPPPTPVVETPVVVTPAPKPVYITPSPKPISYPRPIPSPVPAPRPVSAADLSVRIIAVGVIDSYSGAFVARAPYSPSEISAVQFDVHNIGSTPSGSYTFQAQIPTSQPYTYSSQVQPSLAGGAHVVNTLRFTPAVDGMFTVHLFATDSRQSNNYASVWVSGATQYQPQYQPPYQQQYQTQYPNYPQYQY